MYIKLFDYFADQKSKWQYLLELFKILFLKYF